MHQTTLFVEHEPDLRGVEVWDLFCGAGGFSAGATLAGCRVAFACDSDPVALSTHIINHPGAQHMLCTLPRTDLPLPTDGRRWHLHGSPPCQAFSFMASAMNRGGTLRDDTEERIQAIHMVEWFLEFALASGATTWSFEQVASQHVIEIVEAVRMRHRGKFEYGVFDLSLLGVPQKRVRLLAGTPWMIRRLKRLSGAHRRRSVADVISNPIGTHLRGSKNHVAKRRNFHAKAGERYFVYEKAGPWDGAKRITELAPTVVCNGDLRWVWRDVDGTSKVKIINMTHFAALQTFPPHYRFHSYTSLARRHIGNSVPPLVASLLLGGGNWPRAIDSEELRSPSLYESLACDRASHQ